MKALWVDDGNDPDWAKVEKHGIDVLYFKLFESEGRDNPVYLGDVRDRGYKVGLYGAANWLELGGDGTQGGDGSEFAEKVAAQVKKAVGKDRKPGFPKVQLDHEDHDPDKIAEALLRWRQLMPYQDTSWTMEGMQGGWMDTLFVQTVLSCRVRLAPQLYNGAMTEVWDSLTCARDLTKRGFPDGIISPFYDAKALPVGWDGFAFTMGRLPA